MNASLLHEQAHAFLSHRVHDEKRRRSAATDDIGTILPPEYSQAALLDVGGAGLLYGCAIDRSAATKVSHVV
jgi:hypothetical protein